MKNELVKSFQFCWWSLTIDIKITKYNDNYYIICMDSDLLTVSQLNLNTKHIGQSKRHRKINK